MTVVITGAGGQLGSELCRLFGAAAVGLHRAELDITRADDVRTVLARLAPRVVINTAAYTSVDKAEAEVDACRAVNATAVRNLADACREIGCRLVQISTDYVFGGDQGRRTPYRENDPPDPQGVYAQTKVEGERYAAVWQHHTIVRTCGLYGPPALGKPANNFVDTMLRLGRERPLLRVVDDQQCTPSYVPHVARALVFLVETPSDGVYHVVDSGETTWYGLAGEIFRLAGMEVTLERITTAQYGAAAPRPAYSVLDTSKYQALGGPAMPSWQEALAEYLRLHGYCSGGQ